MEDTAQTDRYEAVAELLLRLQVLMQQSLLWHEQSPSVEALASQQPFCVDTMAFDQWLQFVFLPKMHFLLEQRLPLPQQCGIAPMAEMFYQQQGRGGLALVRLLEQLDQLLADV